MYRVSYFVLVICFFILFVFSKTGRSEERIFTLSEAVDLALTENPALKAADHFVKATQAKVGQARSGFLPRIDLYENYSRTNNPVYSFSNKLNQEVFSSKDFRLNVLNDPSPVSNFNTQVVLSQPIFDQGKTLVGMKQAKLSREIAEKGRERVRQKIMA